MAKKKVLIFDFDKTVTTSQKDFPQSGPVNEKAIEVLKRVKKAGHYLTLLTMRDKEPYLDIALDTLKKHGIIPDSVNETIPKFLKEWGYTVDNAPRKVHGDIEIDDRCIGVPTLVNAETGEEYVDWHKVEEMLEIKGWLPKRKFSFTTYMNV